MKKLRQRQPGVRRVYSCPKVKQYGQSFNWFSIVNFGFVVGRNRSQLNTLIIITFTNKGCKKKHVYKNNITFNIIKFAEGNLHVNNFRKVYYCNTLKWKCSP